MPIRFNRLLIPIILAVILSLGSLVDTSGQAPVNQKYLPIVSYNLTGWIGPYGGSVLSMVVDPFNPQVVYAGTVGSGIFKTVDGGSSWSSINNGLANLQIYSLAINPQNPSNILAGTYHNQVYKSTNAGSSWSWSGMGMQDPAIVYSIAIDPVTPSVIYAATRGESNNNNPPWNGVIYKSTDGGGSWASVLANVGGAGVKDWAYSVAVNPVKHEQVFAALHEHGPYRSNNAGAKWDPIYTGVNDLSGRSIIISPSDPSRLYYGVWHVDSVYKSLNGGDLWSGANRGILNFDVYHLAIDPSDPKTVYMAAYSYGVFKTNNAGDGWTPSGLQSDRMYTVVVNPQRAFNLFAGTSGDGLYRSMDSSVTWQHSSLGINNAMISAAIQSPASPNLIYASIYGGGVYRSINRGQTWEEINKGLDDKYVHGVVMDPARPNILYAYTESGGLLQNDTSTPNGWVKAGQGLPLTSTYQPSYPYDSPFAPPDSLENFINPPNVLASAPEASAAILSMVYAPSDPNIAYLGTFGHGAFRSTNGGASWAPAALGGQTVQNLVVDLADPNLVYAGTSIAGIMYYSTDGGISWKQASLAPQIYSLATSPSVAGVVYAGTASGIYRYQNGTFSSLGLANQSVTSVALDPRRSGVIYAGTGTGAYLSLDSGVTWNPVDDRLNQQTVLSILFDKAIPNVVYFSTKTHGILLVTTQN